MHKRFEQLLWKELIKRVSKLKEIFKMFLALIYDGDVFTKLTTLIEETPEVLRPEKRVNHIERGLRHS